MDSTEAAGHTDRNTLNVNQVLLVEVAAQVAALPRECAWQDVWELTESPDPGRFFP